MKIKTAARLATALTISVILIYAAFTVIIHRSLERMYRDFKTTSDTQTHVNQLRSLTSDYVIYQTERARQQWWTVRDELLAKLNSPEYKAVQKNYNLEDFQAQLPLVTEAFTQLIQIGEKTGLRAPEAAIHQDFRNRLITQIELTFREIILSLIGVRDQIGEEVVSLQLRSIWLDGVALLILISFILANSLFLQKSVVQPVLQLHESAGIIGQGNLDHRVVPAGSGEIRELLQTFNDMTANLQEVTVSRDELIREIEERRRAEKALEESEKRLRSFYESDLLGVIYWSVNGEITDANDKFLEMIGYQREDLAAGRIDWLNMTPPEYRHLDEASFKELQAIGINKTPIEKEYFRKDGTRLPIIVAGAMLDEARFKGVSFILDITARKQAEEALRRAHDEMEQRVRERTEELGLAVVRLQEEVTEHQKTEEALRESQERLRLLANQLINDQEMERGRLSRDIHDDFGQSLMVLHMQLNAILKKNSMEPEIRNHLEKVVSYLLEVTEKVRRFSHDLSPPSLERLGLTEALRELFEDFQEFYDNRGVIIAADLDETKDILPKEADIVIYRICQEFLTNTHNILMLPKWPWL